MEQTAKECLNSYMREWRRKNKEKVKIYNQNYWSKKAKENKSSLS